jgi:beta-lactamase superfamily II metal-dependent hydrolase
VDPYVAAGASIDHLPFCLKHNLPLTGTVQKALLIDGGNDGYGPDVREYLQTLGVIDPTQLWQPQLIVLATHYHDDHQDGLRSLMRNPLSEEQLKARVDNSPTTSEAVRPRQFCYLQPNPQRDRAMGMFPAILNELRSQGPPDPRTELFEIPPGGCLRGDRLELSLGVGVDGIAIKVVVLAADQAYFRHPSGARVEIPNKRGGRSRPLSENDRSIVLMVEYGSFRHFLAGDIGGETCTIEADVEGALAQALPSILAAQTAQNGPKTRSAGHCCSIKLSHHGSRHSNTNSILGALTPCIATISCGFRQYFHGHPNAEAVNRMWSLGSVNVFATEIASRGKGVDFNPDPGERIGILGDIVLRPIDESISRLHRCAGVGEGAVDIQVFGSGVQSWIDTENPNYALRATTAGNPSSFYEIGPFSISCAGH